MSVIYTTLKGIMDPVTLMIVFVNLLAYVVIQTVFFFFVGSQNFVTAISQKADFVYEFAIQDPQTEASLREELESQYNTVDVPETARRERDRRAVVNKDIMIKYLLPPVAVIAVLLASQLVRLVIWGNGMNSIDLFLIFMVLFAFTTEFIFFGLVILQTVALGDQELMAAILGPALDEQQKIVDIS